MQRERTNVVRLILSIPTFLSKWTSMHFLLYFILAINWFLGVCGVWTEFSRPWSLWMKTLRKYTVYYTLRVFLSLRYDRNEILTNSPVRGNSVALTWPMTLFQRKNLHCIIGTWLLTTLIVSDKQQMLPADYRSPERTKNNYTLIADCVAWSQDMYSFGQYGLDTLIIQTYFVDWWSLSFLDWRSPTSCPIMPLSANPLLSVVLLLAVWWLYLASILLWSMSWFFNYRNTNELMQWTIGHG